MLSRGGKIEYSCNVCNSTDIIKTRNQWGESLFECRSCRRFDDWSKRKRRSFKLALIKKLESSGSNYTERKKILKRFLSKK